MQSVYSFVLPLYRVSSIFRCCSFVASVILNQLYSGILSHHANAYELTNTIVIFLLILILLNPFWGIWQSSTFSFSQSCLFCWIPCTILTELLFCGCSFSIYLMQSFLTSVFYRLIFRLSLRPLPFLYPHTFWVRVPEWHYLRPCIQLQAVTAGTLNLVSDFYNFYLSSGPLVNIYKHFKH